VKREGRELLEKREQLKDVFESDVLRKQGESRPALAVAVFWLTAGAIAAADQAAKFLVRYFLPAGASIEVCPPVLYFTHISNPGAAFGLMAYQNAFFIGVSLFLIIGAVCASHLLPRFPAALRIPAALQVGGAAGNMIDRLRWGQVIDFIDLRVWWWVFNLADVAIVVGAGWLFWELWRRN